MLMKEIEQLDEKLDDVLTEMDYIYKRLNTEQKYYQDGIEYR